MGVFVFREKISTEGKIFQPTCMDSGEFRDKITGRPCPGHRVIDINSREPSVREDVNSACDVVFIFARQARGAGSCRKPTSLLVYSQLPSPAPPSKSSATKILGISSLISRSWGHMKRYRR